ncbi:MAG TPA: hypothetical protein PLM47_08940 [Smithellaceae bacterium]|nr:hypothetical protein [Smithellaceae bacterium]HOS09918.1 hypothetical protein [Smithellaceae bacterium]HPD49744.1 hypothetical protein [Smithellaceae bacterium]HPL49928.1 hypothetical protein [Smithellaceae bacterium]HQK27915.1 hypothetical protein [Smithellaceae bacterium]
MIKLCPSAVSALSMKPMVLQYLLPLASSYMISAEIAIESLYRSP